MLDAAIDCIKTFRWAERSNRWVHGQRFGCSNWNPFENFEKREMPPIGVLTVNNKTCDEVVKKPQLRVGPKI
jgi:hypothetical protein